MIKKQKRIVSVWHKKYSYEEMSRDIADLSHMYPERFRYDIIGRSEDDRKIYDIVIGNPEAKKCILVVAAIHGREYITTLLCMKQIEYYLRHQKNKLRQRYVETILQDIAIHYIPMANPDGVTISQYGIKQIQNEMLYQKLKGIAVSKEKRWKANARGVDLNRNFPYHFCVTKEAGSEGYSGKEALSEKESAAINRRVTFLEEVKGLQGVVHYHAMGSEIYASCHTEGETALKTAFMYAVARGVTGYPQADEEENNIKQMKERQDAAKMEIEKQTDRDGMYFQDHGNLREYLLYEKKLPGITVEVGRFRCPGPLCEFFFIWRKNKNLVLREAALLESLL
ncbi:MAG: M14 family zinc carboxypeptidase [Butyribacter sp.]|nr:M14 family zinc carboxypeptidase [bacterium]MDY3854457.1 M14 family zinc carboxypeptidase [Butyribacter sp.]